MKNYSGQIFTTAFFIFLIINTIFCHSVGTQFIETAQQIKRIEKAGGDPEQEVEVSEKLLGRGQMVIVLNLPLFVTLRFINTSETPSAGIGYWIALILGSTYIPLALSLLVIFTIYAPKSLNTLPGVEIEDQDYSEEDERD